MGLFTKYCCVCGKKAGAMTRSKMRDGNYVCFDCCIKIFPKFMERANQIEMYTKTSYLPTKAYFDRSEQVLKPLYQETYCYNKFHMDETHGIFYVEDSLFCVPLYHDLRSLTTYKVDFMPLDGRSGLFGSSVRGYVMLRFESDQLNYKFNAPVNENLHASAVANFDRSNYTYSEPREVAEFEARFAAAWRYYRGIQ